MPPKSGYAAIIGRPNVGKSTLLNAIVGEPLSIVTPKPQTTRHKISGIYNDSDSQIVFLDTPGYHQSSKPLNRVMNDIVDRVVGDADVICLMIEAGQKDIEIEKGLFDRIGVNRCIVLINKADTVARGEYDAMALRIRDEWNAKELIILSALKNHGVAELIETIKKRLPEGEPFFPTDIYTEHPVRFIAAELVREEVIVQMRQEIPYAAAVIIDDFKDATEAKPITVIKATIVVEKDSQKAMVIGKGGSRIKEIGKKSRGKIEKLVGGKVFLELNVRVEKDWTKDSDQITKLGYRTGLE